jgi:OmpA-OmpF porin, OOP family
MRKSLLSIALGLALLSISAAHAQGGTGYLGIGAGWANIGVDCTDVPQCDKSNTGGKLYGGYRFANQWAVEGVYMDWGKATASFVDDVVAGPGLAVPLQVSPVTVTVDGKLRATGLGIGVAYFMPFASNWNGVARLGVISNEGKLTLSGSGSGVTVTDSASKKAAFAYFGLGVGYNLTPNLVLTGEADFSRVKYGSEGEYETDSVRLISLGLRYSF